MQEQTIFDFLYDKYKITNKVRLIELFAGIGSQAKALKNIGVDFETYKVVEFDKYAIASYNAIHDTNFLTLDITQIDGKDLEIVDTDKYTYILTYSFPCQDLSLAGKRKGMKDTSTRSGLLWEVERILNEIKELPQVLLMENVPQVHSKDNIQDFQKWILALEKLGYKSYWKDLNAKDYGICQNRNRTFMISILGDYNYVFPKKQKLKLRLKDMLEDEVDEKYYLSDNKIKSIANWKSYQNPLENILNDDSISPTLTARGAGEEHSGMILYSENNDKYYNEEILKRELCNQLIKEGKVEEGDVIKHSDTQQILDGNKKCVEKSDGIMITLTTRGDCVGVCVKEKEPKEAIVEIGNYSPSNHNASRVVDANGIAPTVMENHGTVTAIVESCGVVIPEATKQGYAIANDGDGVYINRPYQKRGVVQKGMIQTLKTQCDDVGVVVNLKKDTQNYIEWEEEGKLDIDCRAWKENCIAPTTTTTPKTKDLQNDLRIRKLTPKECFRLMGFSDEDFEKASKVNSNAQLYKQAGNSIVVNVLEAIFKELF